MWLEWVSSIRWSAWREPGCLVSSHFLLHRRVKSSTEHLYLFIGSPKRYFIMTACYDVLMNGHNQYKCVVHWKHSVCHGCMIESTVSSSVSRRMIFEHHISICQPSTPMQGRDYHFIQFSVNTVDIEVMLPSKPLPFPVTGNSTLCWAPATAQRTETKDEGWVVLALCLTAW